MTRIFAIILAVGLTTGAAHADPLEDVITSQLDAFNARDADKAFSFASPMIQQLFGTSENFGTMVARGYPMVWDNDFVQFLDRRTVEGSIYQRMLMRDAQGIPYILEYRMIPEGAGWQIDGVAILPAPQAGA